MLEALAMNVTLKTSFDVRDVMKNKTNKICFKRAVPLSHRIHA